MPMESTFGQTDRRHATEKKKNEASTKEISPLAPKPLERRSTVRFDRESLSVNRLCLDLCLRDCQPRQWVRGFEWQANTTSTMTSKRGPCSSGTSGRDRWRRGGRGGGEDCGGGGGGGEGAGMRARVFVGGRHPVGQASKHDARGQFPKRSSRNLLACLTRRRHWGTTTHSHFSLSIHPVASLPLSLYRSSPSPPSSHSTFSFFTSISLFLPSYLTGKAPPHSVLSAARHNLRTAPTQTNAAVLRHRACSHRSTSQSLPPPTWNPSH